MEVKSEEVRWSEGSGEPAGREGEWNEVKVIKRMRHRSEQVGVEWSE